MRQVFAGFVLLVLTSSGALSAANGSTSKLANVTCSIDDEIPVDARQAVDASAKTFVDAIVDMKPYIASQIMVRDARNQVGATESIRVLSDYLHKTGPYNELKLQHTYLPKISGGGPDTLVRCGSNSGTDWVAVETTPGATQSYVLFSAKTVNNDWAVVVWLERAGDIWRVRNIDVTPASIVGHTPDDLLKLAREQRDHGNTLNAQMLYVGARFTVNRGKTYQLSVADKLKEELSNFKGAPELQGKAPYSWTMKGTVFTVSQVTVIGVDSKIGLTFDLPLESWKDDKDADQRSRAFLDAFRAAHPEYAQAFGFLVARAMKPDNSGGFSTVYDNKSGYD